MGICIEFRLQIGKIRTALPRARRIAGLGHEAFDHAMEDDAIVKAAPRQSLDPLDVVGRKIGTQRSEEHTSELQSLMRSSYAVVCLKKKKKIQRSLDVDCK